MDSFRAVLLRSSILSPSQRESLMNSRKAARRRTVSSFRISLQFSLAKVRCRTGSKRASGSRAPWGARPGARRAPVARFLGFLKDSLWLGLKKAHRRWSRVFRISLRILFGWDSKGGQVARHFYAFFRISLRILFGWDSKRCIAAGRAFSGFR